MVPKAFSPAFSFTSRVRWRWRGPLWFGSVPANNFRSDGLENCRKKGWNIAMVRRRYKPVQGLSLERAISVGMSDENQEGVSALVSNKGGAGELLCHDLFDAYEIRRIDHFQVLLC